MPEINFKTPGRIKQFIIFAKRDMLSKISDFQYLLITLFEAPVLAFFLSFLIRYFDESAGDPEYHLIDNNNLPVYLFMSVVVALFMGLTLSADEIFKDRKILKREAFLNLSWNSYLMSKVFVQFGISALQAFAFVLLGNTITGIKGMTFEYWLILFSCWATANMLGLVISDSFKAIVTIYILIPFLIIPQIILSGVLVKFEKLNPGISSPVAIPVYGELIAARWGYEALAVKQFVDNKYARKFYEYDKSMSEARYMKDYWSSRIKGNLDNILIDLKKGTRDENFYKDLLLVSNEFKKTGAELPEIRFEYYENLKPDKVTEEAVKSALNYVESVRKFYVGKYNAANTLKDNLITKMGSGDNETYQKLKNDYFNTSLEEIVTSKNETQKIIDFRGQLIQKLDPVYMDPEYKFIKAHFYSPTKQIFSYHFGTYFINVLVIWSMTFILYFILYFRLVRKALSSGENILRKRGRNSEIEII